MLTGGGVVLTYTTPPPVTGLLEIIARYYVEA